MDTRIFSRISPSLMAVPYVLLLAGFCSSHSLALAQAVTDIVTDDTYNAPAVGLAPASANFGTVLTGKASTPIKFTLTNNQDVAVSITTIGFQGSNPTDFKVKKTTCTSQLAAKSKCSISITMTPGASGSRSGALTVTDSADDSPQQSQLLGAGGVSISVFGTGHVAGKTDLARFGTIDGNFTLISCPAGECVSNDNSGYDAFVTLTGQYPFPPWHKDTGSARWIGPANGGDEDTQDAPGLYQYQETFDLTGFDLATVTLKGSFATDNSGYIQLNGVTVGPANSNLVTLTPFALASGFNQGINRIDFVVTNGSPDGLNPTGLLVELSGIGVPSAAVSETTRF